MDVGPEVGRPLVRIRYDAKVDALSIIFRETTVTTEELADGICGEFDESGVVVGIEIPEAAANAEQHPPTGNKGSQGNKRP
jgi:uncharacterized protein YuzE